MAASETRNILLAIDASENTDYAFEWYCQYLHHPGNYVIACHVPQGFDLEKARSLLAKGGEMTDQMEKAYAKITDLEAKYISRLKENKIQGRVLSVPSKNAGETLVKVAREEQVFAVLMGTRGLSKLKKVILGSVSDHVVQQADCPVIVVRKPSSGKCEKV